MARPTKLTPATDRPEQGPEQVIVFSDAGMIVRDVTYVGMQARLRLVVRVPAPLAQPGGDLPGDFEPALRQAVADALVGLRSGGLVVEYVAVGQFEDSEV